MAKEKQNKNPAAVDPPDPGEAAGIPTVDELAKASEEAMAEEAKKAADAAAAKQPLSPDEQAELEKLETKCLRTNPPYPTAIEMSKLIAYRNRPHEELQTVQCPKCKKGFIVRKHGGVIKCPFCK